MIGACQHRPFGYHGSGGSFLAVLSAQVPSEPSTIRLQSESVVQADRLISGGDLHNEIAPSVMTDRIVGVASVMITDRVTRDEDATDKWYDVKSDESDDAAEDPLDLPSFDLM